MVLGSMSMATRRAFLGLVVMALLCGASGIRAQGGAAAPAGAQAQPADPFKFSGNNVLVMWQVKPEAAADFTKTWADIKAKLSSSDKPDLKELGDSLNIMKVTAEMPAGSPTIIVFELNPPSKTLSYDPGKILYMPGLWERAAADAMYKKVGQDVLAGLNVLPLEKIGG